MACLLLIVSKMHVPLTELPMNIHHSPSFAPANQSGAVFFLSF